jgi:hypothetical protein
MSLNPSPWNSLEIAKLTAGLLTPAALAFFGVYIHRLTKRFEDLQWRSQKLIETRLKIYDELAPQLNDLLCYFTYVGCWKDLNPPEVIALKRTIDKKVFLAAPLFSESFFSACMEFQNLCFETYSGWGRDALLRAQFERREKARPNEWKAEWKECFSDSASDPKAIRAAYKEIMEAFAVDIGVHPSFVVPHSGRVPGNIK